MTKRFFITGLLVLILAGCSAGPKEAAAVKVYSRDESSGTRGAFHEIVGIENLTNEAAIASSNGDMATQVGQNVDGIGYVSLTTDFEKNNLKALKYEGVEATIDTVNNGTYKLARPFGFLTRATGDFGSEAKEALVKAFIDYIVNSKEGRQVVLSAGGIVDVAAGTAWSELKKNHPIVDQDNSSITITTGGSTSVNSTLKAALEQFVPMAGNFKFVMNQNGSGDAHKRTIGSEKDSANAADIGFVSRDFKADEKANIATSLLSGVYAKDAVVIVVSKSSTITDIKQATVKDVFEGKLKTWDEVK